MGMMVMGMMVLLGRIDGRLAFEQRREDEVQKAGDDELERAAVRFGAYLGFMYAGHYGASKQRCYLSRPSSGFFFQYTAHRYRLRRS